MSWVRWQPTKEQPWDLKRVVHLHRRAGFGATWNQIQRDLQAGPDAAIDRILKSADDNSAEFDSVIQHVGASAVGSNNPERLKAWWLLRMLTTPCPLREKLTLMWHNHFATSNSKVQNLAAMKRQNEKLYSLGLGDFRDLLKAMAQDPAILVWLDAPSNRKGKPNENLAREIIELFSLGVGNYSEGDVRQAARALTGWSLSETGEFIFRAEIHDDGSKSILGETGQWTGDDLVRILLKQTAVAERVSWRLCTTFMGEKGVTESNIQSLANHLQSHNLSIRSAVETILRSEAFFAESNIGTKVSDPVDFVVASVRAAEITSPLPSTIKLARWTAELGQDLFYPPNVGGWKSGRNWLSTRYIIARANFAATLSEGGLSKSFAAPDVAQLLRERTGSVSVRDAVTFFNKVLLGGRLSDASRNQIEEALQFGEVKKTEELRYAMALLLALPEFQEC